MTLLQGGFWHLFDRLWSYIEGIKLPFYTCTAKDFTKITNRTQFCVHRNFMPQLYIIHIWRMTSFAIFQCRTHASHCCYLKNRVTSKRVLCRQEKGIAILRWNNTSSSIQQFYFEHIWGVNYSASSTVYVKKETLQTFEFQCNWYEVLAKMMVVMIVIIRMVMMFTVEYNVRCAWFRDACFSFSLCCIHDIVHDIIVIIKWHSTNNICFEIPTCWNIPAY